MRRRLALLLVLLLGFAAAPVSAAEPTGEIVVVANGNATGTVTLPSGVEPQLASRAQRMTFSTRSPHIALVFANQGRFRWGMLVIPHSRGLWDATSSNGALPAGRSVVSVVTEGPLTLHLPAKGLRGRLVIRLATPLKNATGVRRAVATTSTGGSDTIPFTTNGPAFVVNQIEFVSDARWKAEQFCTVPDSLPCTTPYSMGPDPAGTNGGTMFTWDEKWNAPGPARAEYRIWYTDNPTFRATHTLIVVPLG